MEATCSSRCTTEQQLCRPERDSCCPGLECTRSIDTPIKAIYTCQRSVVGLPVGSDCMENSDCFSNRCHRPSCDVMSKLGVDSSLCRKAPGQCALANSAFVQTDLDSTQKK